MPNIQAIEHNINRRLFNGLEGQDHVKISHLNYTHCFTKIGEVKIRITKGNRGSKEMVTLVNGKKMEVNVTTCGSAGYLQLSLCSHASYGLR